MIDYSRFENIEISDDSDVEVHPNVDKKSFIRWKQRDIHEKRERRNHEIKNITIQKEMYGHLNRRVDAILADKGFDLSNNTDFINFLNSKFDKNEVLQSELIDSSKEELIPYNEQIEDLILQLRGDLEKDKVEVNDLHLRDLLSKHKKKIDELVVKQDARLKELIAEKNSHIEISDLKEGFSSTFINRDDEDEDDEDQNKKIINNNSAKKTEKIETIETINSPAANGKNLSNENSQHQNHHQHHHHHQEAKPSKPLNELGELELLQETEEYSKIKQMDKLYQYLIKHLYIISEQQKDSLLMTAFDFELKDDSAKAYDIVYKAMMLKFLDDLTKQISDKDVKVSAIHNFFDRIGNKAHPAAKAFEQEIAFTYDHIKKRCKIIKEEEKKRGEEDGNEEAEELIQLRSTDDNTVLSVNIPSKEEDPERYKIYNQLPEDFKKALATQSIDEVNKVFEKIKIDEAERILDLINEAGVISVDVLENEQEFENLKNEIKGNSSIEDKIVDVDQEVKHTDEPADFVNTADVVD